LGGGGGGGRKGSEQKKSLEPRVKVEGRITTLIWNPVPAWGPRRNNGWAYTGERKKRVPKIRKKGEKGERNLPKGRGSFP